MHRNINSNIPINIVIENAKAIYRESTCFLTNLNRLLYFRFHFGNENLKGDNSQGSIGNDDF